MRWCKVLEDLLDLCASGLRTLAELCLVLMLIGNLLNIASRALFEQSLTLVFPWTVVLFVWMVFLGFFPVYRAGKDITVNLLSSVLGPRGRRISDLSVSAVVLLLMSVLLLKAPVLLAAQVGNIEMVGLPRYSLSLPLFLSCALIALHFTAVAIRTLSPEPGR